MAVAHLDRNRIGRRRRDCAPRPALPARARRRRRGSASTAARLKSSPQAAVDGLKHDNAVGQTIGGDDIGHLALTGAGAPRLADPCSIIFNDSNICVCFTYNYLALFYGLGRAMKSNPAATVSKPSATKSKPVATKTKPGATKSISRRLSRLVNGLASIPAVATPVPPSRPSAAPERTHDGADDPFRPCKL